VAYALTRHLETICEFSWKARDWLSNAQYASSVLLLVYLISQSNVPLPCMCTFCPFCFLIYGKKTSTRWQHKSICEWNYNETLCQRV